MQTSKFLNVNNSIWLGGCWNVERNVTTASPNSHYQTDWLSRALPLTKYIAIISLDFLEFSFWLLSCFAWRHHPLSTAFFQVPKNNEEVSKWRSNLRMTFILSSNHWFLTNRKTQTNEKILSFLLHALFPFSLWGIWTFVHTMYKNCSLSMYTYVDGADTMPEYINIYIFLFLLPVLF